MTEHDARREEPALVIVRVFDAPRELVWRVWSEPEHIRRWCAPDGFTLTGWESDGRVGGAWRLTMRSDEWGEVAQHGVYHEITPPERLVYTLAWEEPGIAEHAMLVTVTFTAEGDRTRMTFHQAPFATPESRDSHVGGWNEVFDRLAAEVAAASG